MLQPPFDNAYWVLRGRLMAGEYPGDYDPAVSLRRIRGLFDCGIRSFINLMEASEESVDARQAPAYAALVEQCASRLGVVGEWLRFEIHDMSAPSAGQMGAIQRAIDDSLERERPVYVHCWRGRGRTGTVVASHLIRQGLATPENFLAVVEKLRGQSNSSPETPAQIDFVRSWRSGPTG